MTSSTKQALFILAGGVVAFLVVGVAVLFGTALYRGTTTVPDVVVTQVWTVVTGLLVVSSTAVMAYLSSRNAQRSRENATANAEQTQAALGQKVEAVGLALHDGIKNDFAIAAADLVAINADKTAATLVDTNVAAATQKAIDAAAQKTRDDLASVHAKLDAMAQLMAQRAQAPILASPPVAGDQARVVDAIKETTAAVETVAENTMPPKEKP